MTAPPPPSAGLGWLSLLQPGPGLLVALDIDGTILRHDTSLSENVRAAVGQLRDSGTHVVLATGRSVHATVPVARELGLATGWAVCSNGAVTVRLDADQPEGYEFYDVVTFNPGPTLRLLREHLPQAIFAVEELGKGFALTEMFPDGELTGRQRVVDFEELCAMPATRVTMRAPELGKQDFHKLVDRSGLHGVSYAVGWSAWLDIAPEAVSKASALEQVRQRLGVAPDATVAAGDGRNDIEMLTWAGLGVAMGGADEVTRAAADAATGTVEEDGLVPVLRTIVAGAAQD